MYIYGIFSSQTPRRAPAQQTGQITSVKTQHLNQGRLTAAHPLHRTCRISRMLHPSPNLKQVGRDSEVQIILGHKMLKTFIMNNITGLKES